MPPIITIVGKSESGKTTLIERLVPELKNRGYKIGTTKHASHGFDIDKKGKDSWRHKQAGADMVIVTSPGKIAMVKDEDCETLDCIEKYFHEMDLVIAEGYKKEDRPRIEVFRSTQHKMPLCPDHKNLVAFVTDKEIDLKVPVFGLEEIERLAGFIEKKYLAKVLPA